MLLCLTWQATVLRCGDLSGTTLPKFSPAGAQASVGAVVIVRTSAASVRIAYTFSFVLGDDDDVATSATVLLPLGDN